MTIARPHFRLSTTTETQPEPEHIWAKLRDSAVDPAIFSTAEWAQFFAPSEWTGRDVESTSQGENFPLSDSMQDAVSLFVDRNSIVAVTHKHFRYFRPTLQPTVTPRISTWRHLAKVLEVFRSQDVAKSWNLFPPHIDLDNALSENEYRGEIGNQIRQLLEVAGDDNWDGEGAQAISIDTVRVAEEIVNIFPEGIDAPEISATPHGEVDFDWIVSSKTMMTLSACPSNEIAFAAIFENARVRDRQAWSGRLSVLLSACFEMLRAALAESRR